MDPERKTVWFAAGLTLAVHTALALVLATASGAPDLEATRFGFGRRLCEGVRCAEKPIRSDRRGTDEGPVADLGIIEATVIPVLGHAEPKPGELPKLVKYEQPEKIEEAVNVSRENPTPAEVPNKADRAKKAETDRSRSGGLASLLGAPEDDDPRKRPTALDKIVGQRDGSVYGSGTQWTQGNVYGGKVALAIRQQFTVPPYLSDADLRKLRVRIRITKLSESGEVQGFDLVERSSDNGFNSAAMQAIKRFVSREGGTARLPSPDAATLSYINRAGMVIDLDGALFRR
ncbi:MAG: TonB C-terminal domain-containing protein [Deltaproteobacteria bacterium]|nr:TonB C-terminal domain-containing protein [Deltaproteobacteria bacterium]